MLTNGCVLIEGPKWCGKSTTAERFAKSVVKLQKPATFRQYKLLADIGDSNLLSGAKPLLFDEWQKIPELWDYIRNEIDEVKRNPNRARAILKSYARNISTSVPLTTILRDIESNFEVEDIRTVDSYVNAFNKLFVLEDTESWTPRLRSKTTIRTTSTRHFTDPSIATAVLKASPGDLMNDLNTFGLIFENLVIRDLKIYAQFLEGNVYNYNDRDGLEADAIIHLNNGDYGLIEVKIGGEALINEGVENLKKLSEKIDHDKMNKPSFLAIITAADMFAYTRSDGVHVIPLACLKP